MNPVQTWGQAITISLMNMWERFVIFLPGLIGALLVFLLGLIVAMALGKVIEKIVRSMHVDDAIEKIKITHKFKEIGIKLNLAVFFGELVKWFLVLVFLMASTDILGLDQVTKFLDSIIMYIPDVVVATVILSIAFLFGNFAYSVVRGSTMAAGVISATLLATIIKWAIMIFGLLAALVQLGIATSLVNTIFIGFIAALSLATGLAFGIGGKEEAALILKKLREELSAKNKIK